MRSIGVTALGIANASYAEPERRAQVVVLHEPHGSALGVFPNFGINLFTFQVLSASLKPTEKFKSDSGLQELYCIELRSRIK